MPLMCWAVLVCLSPSKRCSADLQRWIGTSSVTGEVSRPANYEKAISSLSLKTFDFEDLSVGLTTHCLEFDDLALVVGPVGNNLSNRSGEVAGALPGSAPNALLIMQPVSGQVPSLNFILHEPIASVGFTLMGLKGSALIRAVDQDQEYLFHVPAVSNKAVRRHIGFYSSTAAIHELQITPQSVEEFSIDDIQVGYHSPEPDSLILLCFCMMLVGRKRRSPVSTRRNMRVRG